MRLDASPTSMSPTQDVILVRVTGCQLTSSVRQEGEQADWITHCVISIWFTVMQIALFFGPLTCYGKQQMFVNTRPLSAGFIIN